jgi:hypothetical protein
MKCGHTLVGLHMSGPDEVDIMLRALEARLRGIETDHPDRARLEDWRRQARNFQSRGEADDWVGWEPHP